MSGRRPPGPARRRDGQIPSAAPCGGEREGAQRERGATTVGRLALAPAALSEEWALSEREGAQRERGATTVGRLALAPADLSEEWIQ